MVKSKKEKSDVLNEHRFDFLKEGRAS